MVVHALPSGEVWIWNALAYAASHCSCTEVIVAVPPRSTRNHCGSLQALPQRVDALPSKAPAAGAPPFSVDEARAGFPCDRRESAACADWMPNAVSVPASVATAIGATTLRNHRRRWGDLWVFTGISTFL